MNAIENLRKTLSPKGQLDFIYLNITDSCNLKCFYCYEEHSLGSVKKGKELSLHEIAQIADDCKKLGATYVTITGGEPFLNENWFEIGKLFSDIQMIVSYSTNGTLLTEENIKKLSRINASLQISLDGDDETMELVTKGKDVATKIIETTKTLKENDVDFMFNSVVGKHNIAQLDSFIEMIDEYDIRCRLTPYAAELNSKYSEYALSIQEKYEIIMKVNSHNKEKNKENIFMSIPPLMTPKYIPLTINPACGWAYNIAGILSNGDVSVCAPASGIDYFIAGNVRETSFIDIWNDSELFKKLRNYEASDLKGVCAICPVKDVCIGGCRVSPYAKHKDECESETLCQDFYDAVLSGKIDTDEFPIGAVKIDRSVTTS